MKPILIIFAADYRRFANFISNTGLDALYDCRYAWTEEHLKGYHGVFYHRTVGAYTNPRYRGQDVSRSIANFCWNNKALA